MKIEKFKKIKTNQYELTLEDESKIKLYEDVILKENLLLTKNIDNVEDILKKNSEYSIFEISYKYLSHKVISIYGMKEYLLKKGFDEKNVQNAIDSLINKGYLNDYYYAKCYINDHINLSNDGPKKIINHLENMHIDSNIYLEYLDLNSNIWYERINKYLEKQLKINKKSAYVFKNKMLLNLINLGYDKEMINDCLNKIKIENSDELMIKEKEKIRKKLERKYSGEELERKIKERLYRMGYY